MVLFASTAKKISGLHSSERLEGVGARNGKVMPCDCSIQSSRSHFTYRCSIWCNTTSMLDGATHHPDVLLPRPVDRVYRLRSPCRVWNAASDPRSLFVHGLSRQFQIVDIHLCWSHVVDIRPAQVISKIGTVPIGWSTTIRNMFTAQRRAQAVGDTRITFSTRRDTSSEYPLRLGNRFCT